MNLFNLILFCVFGVFVQHATGCTDLTASEDVVGSINSHDEYGTTTYEHNYHACWIITAPSGFRVQAWNDEFHLERHYDYMNVYCGPDGEEGVIGEYHGSQGISANYPINSETNVMYMEIETDYSINATGFIFNYTAVNATTTEGDCIDWDEWNEDHPGEEHHYYGNAGTIAGIVIAVIIMIIVLSIISACVVCFVCSIKTRHKRLVGFQHGYPLQAYPTGGDSGMVPVGGAVGYARMAAPPVYQATAAAGGIGGPTEVKVHPDQMGDSYGAHTTSPPPTYSPQVVGHT